MGWEENDGSDETYTSFTMGSLRLALYPIDLLGKEAAPRDDVVSSDAWNGVTLGIRPARSLGGSISVAPGCARRFHGQYDQGSTRGEVLKTWVADVWGW